MRRIHQFVSAAIVTAALAACTSSSPPRAAARHASMGIDATLPAATRAHAQRLIAELRRELPKYRDLSIARRAGFRPEGDNVPVGALKHWINVANVRIGWQHLDPERPMALLYRNTARGYELAGAMFAAPYASSPIDLNNRVPLALGHWHAHLNICEPLPGVRIADRVQRRRFGFSGSIVSRTECELAGGALLDNVYGWMVHVYPFEPTLEQQFG